MARVHLLDESTIAKIAAGEIIERPASVVKELIENSIDAGAKHIEVEIKNGGRQLIRVTDDGCGMTQEDVLLAVERHATSKINSFEDLLNIKTLGFRGEALPSIAAVSKMEIYTKTREKAQGTYLEINGGKIIKVKPAGCADGTSIYVHDLFLNTPVRLKYLKTIPTEAGLVAETVGRMAIAYPDIAFHLKHHNYDVIQTTGNNDPYSAILSIFGKDIAKEMLALNWEEDGIRIHGWLGKPSIAKSSRHYEIMYVNKRLIRNRIIGNALEKAFHTLLPISRYPLAIIFLEISPENVDINVHPAKQEVKFANEPEIYKLLYHVFTQTLKKHLLMPNWQSNAESDVEPSWHGYKQQNIKAASSTIQEVLPEIMETKESPVLLYQELPQEMPETNLLNYHGTEGGYNIEALRIIPRVLCRVYVPAEDEQGFIFFDIHAVHERILFEKFMKKNRHDDIQAFLIPQNITFSFQQMKAMQNLIPVLKDMGFELEDFGPQTFLLRSAPAIFTKDNLQEILTDLADLYLNLEVFHDPHQLKEKFWINLACRKAIKAGEQLHAMEIESLIKELFNCENPFTCPHGRPTMVKMSKSEIEKKFLRRS